MKLQHPKSNQLAQTDFLLSISFHIFSYFVLYECQLDYSLKILQSRVKRNDIVRVICCVGKHCLCKRFNNICF